MDRRNALWIAPLFLLFACTDEGPAPASGSSISPLVEGRRFLATKRFENGQVLTGTVLTGSSVYAEIVDLVNQGCEAAADDRFANSVPLPNAVQAVNGCGAVGALAQQVALCSGYAFQTMADAVIETEIHDNGFVRPRPARPDPDDPLSGQAPLFTIPVPSTSDAATLTLIAATFFQQAALKGRELVSASCPDGTLLYTVPGGRHDQVGGTSGAESDRVRLGFVVASATAEALGMLTESSDAARQRIAASAQAALSSGMDEGDALRQTFRGRHGSRLEIAHMLFGTSPSLFEPYRVPMPDGSSTDGEGAGELVVCDEPPRNEVAVRATELLRGLRIDPTLPRDMLFGQLRMALENDYPEAFPPGGEPDGATLLAGIGIGEADLLGAARRLQVEAATSGRTITTIPLAPGETGPVRVTGLSPSVVPPDRALHFARTVGAGAIDNIPADAEDTHEPSEALASGGLLATADVVATAVERALGRADLGDSAERALLESSRLFVRELIPMRAQVCVGTEGETGVLSRARLRLYGAREDTLYELWLGEAGLSCATRGNVEGLPCDLANVHVAVTPTTAMDGAASGLGARYLEWDLVPPTGLPDGQLSTSQRIYVTAQSADRATPVGADRSVVAAFGLEPGTRTGPDLTWSRCVWMPAGRAVIEALGDDIALDARGCWRPETSCAGLPENLRLPLEDELSEAGEGRDEIESSFLHYLRLARQAADEADLLGEELVRQGLSMDERAEQAREELEGICGGVQNVDRIPATPVNACSCPDGTACCADGSDCRAGICVRRELSDYLDPASPDHASIESCLGDGGDLVTVALGDRPLCYWRFRTELGNLLPPCACGPGGCPPGAPENPACPALALLEDGSETDFTCGGVFSALPAGYEVGEPTDTIGLTAPSTIGPSMTDCMDLARLRSRIRTVGADTDPVDPDLLDRVLQQRWLDLEPMKAIATMVGYRPELFGLASVTRGGASWISTGSVDTGPNADDPMTPDDERTFPCARYPGLLDTEAMQLCGGSVPAAGRSLLCGPGSSLDCGYGPDRLVVNDRLLAAVRTMSILTGSSMDDVLQPVYYTEAATGDSGGRFLRRNLRVALGGGVFSAPDDTRSCRRFGARCDAGRLVQCIIPGFEQSVQCETCLSPFACLLSDELYPGHLREGRRTPEWFEQRYLLQGQILSSQVIGAREDEGSVVPTAACLGNLTESAPVTPDFLATAGGHLCPMLFVGSPMVGGRSARLDELLRIWEPAGPATIAEVLRQSYDDAAGASTNFAARAAGIPPEWDFEQLAREERITNGQVLDALELACLASNDQSGGGCGDAVNTLPNVRSVEDFPQLTGLLSCAADRFDDTLDQLMLIDVPDRLANDLRAGAISPTFPAYRGEYGQTVAELRGSVVSIVNATHQVASNLRDFGGELLIARSRLRGILIEDEIDQWSMISRVSSAAAQCGSSATPWGAAAACSDAIVQTVAAVSIRDLQGQMLDETQAQVLGEVAGMFATRMDMLARSLRDLQQGYADANRLMARLDQLRSNGRRAAARMLFLDRDDVGREYSVNRVIRARFNTTRERYERAHHNAVRYAWIARRAVEQRLGVDMSRMHDPMTLVPPPATWADSVCTMSGIDYSRLSDVDIPIDSYADGYVGDYVTLLESFVESYRFDFPFQDGHDVASLSLRDELLRVRVPCEETGHNLLRWTIDLTRPSFDGLPGWVRECATDEVCPSMTPVAGGPFRTETLLTPGASLPANVPRTLGGSLAFELAGPDAPPGSTEPPPAYAGRWAQRVRLPIGDLLLSWYERVELDTSPPRLRAGIEGDEGTVVVTAPELVPEMLGDETVDRWLDTPWRRAFVRVTNPLEQDVTVWLEPPTDGVNVSAVVIGAPQIEAIDPSSAATLGLPSPYFPTDDDGAYPVGLCEDTHGDQFRSGLHWRRGCERLCPDGFGATCASSGDVSGTDVRCYRETQLTIALDDIERGELIPSGALALGNFNYRFDTVGINLVGVGVVDCTRAETPTECYASAFVPFSLYHAPPYRVRNHQGEEVESSLFPGVIEHAKALVAERYVTVPISSADRALLGDFMRREYRGRPLEGSYRLRIWDAPGLDWSRVEDVQLILNYRYWTRFE